MWGRGLIGILNEEKFVEKQLLYTGLYFQYLIVFAKESIAITVADAKGLGFEHLPNPKYYNFVIPHIMELVEMSCSITFLSNQIYDFCLAGEKNSEKTNSEKLGQ